MPVLKKNFFTTIKFIHIYLLIVFSINSFYVNASNKKEILLGDFIDLKITGPVDIILKRCRQREVPKVVINNDNSNLSDVICKVVEKKLIVSYKEPSEGINFKKIITVISADDKNIRKCISKEESKVSIVIYYDTLQSISIGQGCFLSLDDTKSKISADNFNLYCDYASSAIINFAVKGNLKITCKAASELKAEASANSISVNAHYASDVDLLANSDKLDLDISGCSQAVIKGKLKNCNVVCSSNSHIDMVGCSVRDANVRICSNSDLSINVIESLRGQVFGLSKIQCNGNPKKIFIEKNMFSEYFSLNDF